MAGRVTMLFVWTFAPIVCWIEQTATNYRKNFSTAARMSVEQTHFAVRDITTNENVYAKI